MGLFSKLFKKDVKKETVDTRVSIPDSDLAFCMDYVKSLTKKDAVKISVEKAESKLPITSSKFGGYPYIEKGSEIDPNLVLLAQFNLSEISFDTALPKCGILQFFIDTSYDLGFGRTDLVKYYPSVSDYYSISELEELGVLSTINPDYNKIDWVPFEGEYTLEFSLESEPIDMEDSSFERLFKFALHEKLGIDVIDSTLYSFLNHNDYDYIESISYRCEGSKLLGNPYFTQEDPRDENSNDILLFQMDSDMKKDIMWGDCGICNYFIDKSALANLDFSNVLFNWDCC